MITIFGTTYFTTGAGLVVLVLAAPFLFWFARWLLRPNVEGKPRRVRWLAVGGTTLGLLALLAVGLFWDVYLIGQRAKELCEETGLVVVKRAPPAGILGLTNIESYQALQLPFVENAVNGKRYRYTFKQGRRETEEISEFESEYQLDRFSEYPSTDRGPVDKYFVQHQEVIRYRNSGDVIGTLKTLAIDAGWFDRLLYRLTGFVYKPRVCGRGSGGNVVIGNERMTHRDLVTAIVKLPITPRMDKNGHQNSLNERLAR